SKHSGGLCATADAPVLSSRRVLLVIRMQFFLSVPIREADLRIYELVENALGAQRSGPGGRSRERPFLVTSKSNVRGLMEMSSAEMPDEEHAPLEIRVLGDFGVTRDGENVSLPPSRKTRALLAYLAVTNRPQHRERLCSMFWDVPDDPRGALRWSLSRIRQLVNVNGQCALVTDGN